MACSEKSDKQLTLYTFEGFYCERYRDRKSVYALQLSATIFRNVFGLFGDKINTGYTSQFVIEVLLRFMLHLDGDPASEALVNNFTILKSH